MATALGHAVDAKASYEPSHSDGVAAICGEMGLLLELGHERRTRLRLAGLVHDVGKISIPDLIVRKPGRLTEAEYEVMKSHAAAGAQIVADAGLPEEADWIRHHHEWWDGHGYPDGLAANEIPLESRIIASADAFEVMTAERHYRAPVSEREAITELERGAGTQFDPLCVSVLAKTRGVLL